MLEVSRYQTDCISTGEVLEHLEKELHRARLTREYFTLDQHYFLFL